MAKKSMNTMRKPPSQALSPVQAVEQIDAAINGGGPALNEDQLGHLVDLVTSKGTVPENMAALMVLASKPEHAFPRMMILRRLWQGGNRFLNDEWLKAKFGQTRLTQDEINKMAKHFGEAATIAFLRPPHLVFDPAELAAIEAKLPALSRRSVA